MNNFLRYGDLVVLRLHKYISDHKKTDRLVEREAERENTQKEAANEANQLSKNEHEKYVGYISGTGYLDNRIYFQTVPYNPDLLEDTSIPETQIPLLTNFRDFVFVITPKLNFEFHKDYVKTLNQYKKFLKQLGLHKDVTKERKEIKQNYEEKLSKLRQRVLKEKELNKSMIAASSGSFMNYGNEVQLMHRDSGYFIHAMDECSQTKRIGYYCELSNWFSSRMIFQIIPRFKSRDIGDLIQAGESVLFKSTYNSCFISHIKEYNKEIYNDFSKFEINSEHYFRRHKHLVDPSCTRFQLYLSQEVEVSWKIELHSRIRNHSQDRLYGDSLIKLQHTESNAYIGADIPMIVSRPEELRTEVFARTYMGNLENEITTLGCIWEIEHTRVDKRGVEFNCSLMINSQNESYRLSQPFRLKHYITGKYLNYKLENKLMQVALSNHLNTKNPAEYVPLLFEPLMKSAEYLRFGHSYYMKSKLGYVRHLTKQNLSNNLLINQYKTNSSDSGFVPLEDSFKEHRLTSMNFDKEFSTEDAYLIKNIDDDYKEEMFFIKSGLHYLNEIVSMLRFNKELLPTETFSKVQTLLKRIILYLYVEDVGIEEIQEVELTNFEPIQRRQFMFRELGYLELLTDIVFEGFRSGLYSYSSLVGGGESADKVEFFTSTLQLSYTSIKHIIQEYRPNELYASQWLQAIIKQSLLTIDTADIYASTTLIELLDNNKKILEERINDRIIKQFIQEIVQKEKDEEYLEILYVLCICAGESIGKNQKALTEMLLYDQSVASYLHPKINFRDTIEIYNDGEEEWVPIEEFGHDKDDELSYKFFRYFNSLIKLFSAICYNRNQQAIKYLQSKFPYKLCFRIVIDPKISSEVKAVFLLLLRDLWVNITPYYPVELPNNIVIWEEVNEKVEFPHTDQNIEQYKELKEFVLATLENITPEQLSIDPKEGMVGMIHNSLQLCISFVELGFYSKEEINRLVQYLRALHFQKLKAISPEIIECKKVIVVIFEKLIYFLADIRTKLFCVEFKKIYSRSTNTLDENHAKGLQHQSSLLGLPEKITRRNKIYPSFVQSKSFKFNMMKENEGNEVIDKFDSIVFEVIRVVLADNSWIVFDKRKYFKNLLLEISEIDNYSLKTSFLNLMNLIHSQSRIFKESLQNLQFITPVRLMLYRNSVTLAKKMQDYSNNIANYYSADRCKELVECITTIENLIVTRNQAIELEEIEDINKVESKVSLENSMTTESEDEEHTRLGLNGAFKMIITEAGGEFDSFMQDLLRNLHVIEYLCKILKYDLEIRKSDDTIMNIDLIKKIYWLLSLSCKGNADNKAALLRYTQTIFFEHLNPEHDLNVELLLRGIIYNNKTLLVDFNSIKIYANTLLLTLQEMQSININKTLILQTTSFFMKYKSMLLKNNQDYVMTLLFYKKNARNITGDYSSKAFHERMKIEFTSIKIFKDRVSGRFNIIFSNEMCYFIALLDMINICGEGKNSQTEAIGQRVLQIQDIEMLVMLPEANLIFKASLIKFFFDIYLDIEKELPLSLQLGMMKIISFLSIELKNNLLLFEEPNTPITSMGITEKAIKYSNTDFLLHNKHIAALDALTIYTEILADCFFAIIPKMNQITKGGDKTILGIVSDISILGVLKKSITDNSLRDKLDKLGELAHDPELFNSMIEGSPVKRGETTKDIYEDGDSGFFSQMSTLERDRSNGGALENNITNIYKQIQRIICDKEYERIVEKEFEEWIELINELEEENGHEKFELFVTFMRSLVVFFNDNTSKIKEELALTGLKIFTKFIENITENENLSCEDFDSDIWQKMGGKIIRRQNILLDTGVVKWICKIFQTSSSAKLKNSALVLSIALLFGGNKKGQLEYFEIFNLDSDNRILSNLMRYIDNSFNIIERNMTENNDRKLKTIINEKDRRFTKDNEHTQIILNTEIKNIDFEFTLINRIFRFLQLLCEGHNSKLQKILREQKKSGKISVNFKEVNFISYSASIFGRYCKFFNPICAELGLKIIEFMVEVIQGPCTENQKMLYASKTIDSCKIFLNDLFIQKDYFEHVFDRDTMKILDFVKKVIKLLTAMLEGNYDKKMIIYMANSLNIDFLLEILLKEYHDFIDRNKSKKNETEASVLKRLKSKKMWADEIVDAFDIYFLINTIDEVTYMYTERLKILSGDEKIAYTFFQENSAHIEIVFNGRIEKYYFVIQPACGYLGDDAKESFMESLNRESPNEKLTDFINKIPILFDTIDMKANLRNSLIRVHPRLFTTFRFIALMICLTISTIMAITFSKEVENNEAFTRKDFDESHPIFTILGIIHIVVSVFMLIFWLLIEGPMKGIEGWRKRFLVFKRKLNYDLNLHLGHKDSVQQDLVEHIQHLLIKNIADISTSERIEIIKFINDRNGANNSLNTIQYYVEKILFITKSRDFLYLSLYLLVSVLAFFNHNKNYLVAYSVLMLDMAVWFDDMINVINAISYNMNQLFYTLILGIVVMYNYTLFAYTYIDDTFFNSSIGSNGGENMCTNLIQCFLTIFSLGPRSSGGIGDMLLRQSFKPENRETFYVRYFFDLSCFLLINLIFMNILFGIIIDTFAGISYA